ncbi:MAG: hypothetical protein AB7G28_18360 [Pirellulales bacterium]
MNPARALVLLLLLVEFASGQDKAAAPPVLKSLHGTMITLIDSDRGIEMEVWAKGNNVRSEIKMGDAKVVVVQRGDTMYTFSPGKSDGQKTRFESGLAAHGLIEQIAIVKSRGKKERSQVAEGIQYDQYSYNVDAPQEQAIVLLETKTSLPKDWFSVVKNGDREPAGMRIVFRDLEANVEVPDELFELPEGVKFSDVTAADLMSTPIPQSVPKGSTDQ